MVACCAGYHTAPLTKVKILQSRMLCRSLMACMLVTLQRLKGAHVPLCRVDMCIVLGRALNSVEEARGRPLLTYICCGKSGVRQNSEDSLSKMVTVFEIWHQICLPENACLTLRCRLHLVRAPISFWERQTEWKMTANCHRQWPGPLIMEHL